MQVSTNDPIIVYPAPSQNNSPVTLLGSWSAAQASAPGAVYVWFVWGVSPALDAQTEFQNKGLAPPNASGAFDHTINPQADENIIFRAHGSDDLGQANGSSLVLLSAAMEPTVDVPVTSELGSSTTKLTGTFVPRVFHSTCTVLFEFKELGAQTWTQTASSNFTGYANQSYAVSLTGLTPNTTYEFRIRMTRTTSGGTSTVVSGANFTTSGSDPILFLT